MNSLWNGILYLPKRFQKLKKAGFDKEWQSATQPELLKQASAMKKSLPPFLLGDIYREISRFLYILK
jgi:hypothetical protein